MTSSLPSAAALSVRTLGATGAIAVISQSAPQYLASRFYTFAVAPPAGAGVQLTFTFFDTGLDYDFVTVYNDTTLAADQSPLLGQSRTKTSAFQLDAQTLELMPLQPA